MMNNRQLQRDADGATRAIEDLISEIEILEQELYDKNSEIENLQEAIEEWREHAQKKDALISSLEEQLLELKSILP